MSSRGVRNRNPGNIRSSGVRYKGEVQPSRDSSFKEFESMAWGYRAMFMLLHTYQKRYGLTTITEMVSRWAPPTENHTKVYIDSVARSALIDASAEVSTLNPKHMIPIVAAMSRVENGVSASMCDVEQGWSLFFADKR